MGSSSAFGNEPYKLIPKPEAADLSAFSTQIHDLLTTDPGLPRSNPTRPFWQDPPHPSVSSIQSESLAAETDVVIIGSGVTSCSVTKALLETPAFKDLRITVLEARTLVSGATGRNGGHLVSAAGHTFSDLAARLGTEQAVEIARFSLANVDRLPEVIKALGNEKVREASELRPVKRLGTVADEDLWKHHQESVRAFSASVPERRDHHRLLEKDEVEKEWGIQGALGGIGQKTAYALWPYRLFTGVFQHLLTTYPDRLTIETNTPVLSVSEASSHQDDLAGARYLVTTSRGEIRAKKVIYCTNAYTSHLLPQLRGKLYPLRGHVSTQEPGPKFPESPESRSWSRMDKIRLDPTTGAFHYGLYYLQQNAKTKDIFVGVENQKISECLSSDDTTVSDISRKDLSSILPRMFAALNDHTSPADEDAMPKIKSIWSGIIGCTTDGFPLVGRLPPSMTGRKIPGPEGDIDGGEEWMAAGFNGYGMDKCWLTGEALVAMMAHKDAEAPAWFPRAYLITEERFQKRMGLEQAVKKFGDLAMESL